MTTPAAPPSSEGGRRGFLARALGGLADVRRGEVASALLFALDAFLLLTAYYVLKTVREPLVLTGGGRRISGAELKTYATAFQAVLLLLLLVPLYGRLTSGVSRRHLIRITVAVLLACLASFNLLAHRGVSVAVPYYVWLGITSPLLIAQFWSFANDYYSQEQGERLFPVVATGGSLGAIVGAALAAGMLGRLRVVDLMIVAGALLLLYLGVHALIERLPRRAPGAEAAAPLPPPPLAPGGGLRLAGRNPYLRLLALTVVIATMANSVSEFMLSRTVSEHAAAVVAAAGAPASPAAAHAAHEAEGAVIATVYARFFSAVNLLGFLLQAFVVGRLFRRIGVDRAAFVFPAIALGSYALIAGAPIFSVVIAAKLIENSSDYSLHNTVRQTLFLPTSREAKYQAKAAIDGFFFRMGDVLGALLVLAGVHLLELPVRGFALANLLIGAVWLPVIALVAAGYRQAPPRPSPTSHPRAAVDPVPG
jgi:AAA family ATP:ADP antiporter